MGLTHYWEREIELPKDKFAQAVDNCAKLFEMIEIPLSGSGGAGNPVLTPENILFNGAQGSICEDFCFSRTHVPKRKRERAYAYCKTEGLPYDICVRTVLIILKHFLQEMVTVASDCKNNNWQKARDLCQTYLGYGDDFELEEIK